MTTETDLSVSPYFDDYNEKNNYYRVLFRPGVSVQVRELNQLQTMLQKQIERFGDHVFKQGTIVDGCDITFHSEIDYVKLRDVTTSSNVFDVNDFLGYRVKNQNDQIPLEAVIVTATRGFESTTPDLNTLYVRYINSGFRTGGNTEGYTTFEPLETLTVFDPNNVIESVVIPDAGKSQGFTPTDRPIFVSAIQVQNTSGGLDFANTFVVGETITDGTASAEIVEILTDVIPESLVFRIKPLATDLQSNDSTAWTFFSNTNIQTTGNPQSSIGRIVGIVGSGAQGVLRTSTLGRIEAIDITNKGSGYVVPPYVSVASVGNLPQNIDAVQAEAQTFIAKVTVAQPIHNPIGSGYAMTVGEGVIYQKGFFARVDEQLVIVEKYGNALSNPPVPDGIVVGFETTETIVNSNQDPSLLDNATGAPNETAPGANRLKLDPRLVVMSKSEADVKEDFLYIAEFSRGRPFKQNRQTVYNIIDNELSRRIAEESGDYVVDQFVLQTKSTPVFADEAAKFTATIDPGRGYISGKRVETVTNSEIDVDKGTDIGTIVNGNISLNYGNYILANRYSGVFGFATGDVVKIYSQTAPFFNAGVAPSSSGLGTQIGQARVRSVVFDSGIPGTPDAVYRVYLFDISMNPGTTFNQARSLFYDSTPSGACNLVLTNNVPQIYDRQASTLAFYAGAPAIKTVSDVSFIYKTTTTQTLGTNGNIVISLAGGGNDEFPYTGPLTSVQMKDLVVVPQANVAASLTLSGTINVTAGSNTATIAGSSATSVEMRPGDYLYVGTQGYVQVSSVANNTHIRLTSNATFNAASANYRLGFPAHVPIAINHPSRSASVDVTKKQLQIACGFNTQASQPVSASYNIRETQSVPVAKVVNRSVFVRMNLSNNIGGVVGPWSVGVADAIRLRKVYRGATNSFLPGDPNITDITSLFFIDNNHVEDASDVSYLYLRPGNSGLLQSADYLLVEFDYLAVTPGQEGLKAPGASGTYPINDTITLANAVNTINTIEVPEMFGVSGKYYDMRDQFDFRPVAEATAAPSTDPSTAPVDPPIPSYATKFNTAVKKFPAPDTELSATIEFYRGRVDSVIIDQTNTFRVVRGAPGSSTAPQEPSNSLIIQNVKIPPYPSVPFILSSDMVAYIDTKIANGKYSVKRLNDYRVSTLLTQKDIDQLQPRRFTMRDISKLERRLSDVEYYTSLNLVETFAQKRAIPGFGGLDRFKFGFYVDGFEDYQFAETTDPGYSASIVDGYLMPRVEEYAVSLTLPDTQAPELEYNTTQFVSQTRATDGGLTVPSVPSVTQTVVCVRQEERTRNQSNAGNVFEEFFYTFSTIGGPVEFYINARDNLVGAEISQSSTPNGPWTTTITSASALPITSLDISTKRLSLNGNRRIEHPGSLERASFNVGSPWGTWVEDQFKLLWTHDPQNGIYYRVRIYKGGRAGGLISQGKRGTFGYLLCYPTDTSVNLTTPSQTTNFQLNYTGVVFGAGGGRDFGINEFVSLY